MTTDLLSVPDFGLLQNSVAAANALTVRSRSLIFSCWLYEVVDAENYIPGVRYIFRFNE